VCQVRVGAGDRAAGAHPSRLPQVPLPRLRQAAQRVQHVRFILMVSELAGATDHELLDAAWATDGRSKRSADAHSAGQNVTHGWVCAVTAHL
jgi:hypothetical protein